MVAVEFNTSHITLHGNSVEIADLSIHSTELVDYLENFPLDDRISKFNQLIQVGLVCIQRASVIQDKDFVQNQLRGVIDNVEKGLAIVPDIIKEKILASLGTNEGQVLHPVDLKIDEVAKVLKDRIDDVKRLLSDDIDPHKKTSKVAQVFEKLEKTLDPDYVKSVPKTIELALNEVTSEHGLLSKSVKSVVIEAIKPLKDEVDNLSREILGQEAAAEALQDTTEKGQVYEEATVSRLQAWCRANGAELSHIGMDNKPGDILVNIKSSSISGIDLRVVIETRDRKNHAGRRPLNDSMEESMSERSADCGIYLSKDIDGFGKEIGDWAEGDCSLGKWVATTDEHLINAIRFLILSHRISMMQSQTPKADLQALEPQMTRIRTALKRVANINKKVTTIRQSADEIRKEGELLRDDIRDSITLMEDSLRISPTSQIPTD